MPRAWGGPVRARWLGSAATEPSTGVSVLSCLVLSGCSRSLLSYSSHPVSLALVLSFLCCKVRTFRSKALSGPALPPRRGGLPHRVL